MTIQEKHDQELDDLLIKAEKDPNELINLVSQFAHSVSDRWDIAEHYHGKIRETAEKWSNGKNVAAGIKELTSVLYYYYTTQFDKVGAASEKARLIFEVNDEPELLGVVYMIKGVNLRSLGQFDEAINFLSTATKLISDDGMFMVYFAFAHYQMGEIFSQLTDYELAEHHYLAANHIADETHDQTAQFRMTNGLGNFYMLTERWNEALDYISRSLEMCASPTQRSRALCDLGIYYTKQDQTEKAEELLEESYQLRHDYGFKDAASTSLIHLGRAQLALSKFEQAEVNGLKALEITKAFNSKSKMLLTYDLLGRTYEAKQQWKEAAQFLRLHQELQQDLNNQQMRNIYKTKNKMIQSQKELIEEAHKEITDSIAYAKRIQTAILPPKGQLEAHLADHFVLYKPKDVVAGDFYWLEPTSDYTFFAAADCTGHGVPGAMVSVVCHNALNRAVREFELRSPASILDKTREIIVEEFEKAEEDVKDGMDICLCAIKDKKLVFSGAHNALWLIRNGVLIEFKGDKQPVGKFAAATNFTDHVITLEEGDTFYITTDGYADQFGGAKGKKFKSKNLKALLISLQDKPLAEHHDILLNRFEEWRGSLEQIDDLCLIGIRI